MKEYYRIKVYIEYVFLFLLNYKTKYTSQTPTVNNIIYKTHKYTTSNFNIKIVIIIVTDSTDKHTDVPDEVTLTIVRWRVKGLTTPDGNTELFNMSKHSRRLPSQTVKPLEPIKAPLLGKGVTSVALTTHNG